MSHGIRLSPRAVPRSQFFPTRCPTGSHFPVGISQGIKCSPWDCKYTLGKAMQIPMPRHMTPQEISWVASAPTEVTRKSRVLRHLIGCWYHRQRTGGDRIHRRTCSTNPVYILHPSTSGAIYIGDGDIKFVFEMMLVEWCVDQRSRLLTCWNDGSQRMV